MTWWHLFYKTLFDSVNIVATTWFFIGLEATQILVLLLILRELRRKR
jgi:hypothetical protein